MIATIRSRSALALGAWLLVMVTSCTPAADRTADAILTDYKAVAVPKFDPAKKDPKTILNYRAAASKAEARKAELALELFQAYPDHEDVPKVLRARWVNTMMDPSTAAETVREIDRAMPLFKDPESSREASFMKAVATIQSHRDTPEAAVSAIDDFIRADPKDRRSAILLAGFASGVEDVGLRTKLLKRLVADYPDHPAAKLAASTLALLDHVGKPIDLEFADAIKGTTVSIKGLKGKVVVLDFWATWCGPCVAEMPNMKTLYANFKDQGVEFIGVSLDAPKEAGGLDKLKAFVAKNEITWPQYYQGNGWESEFSQKMGITSIPQLFLVDADGNLASIEARGKLETLIPQYLAKAKVASNAR